MFDLARSSCARRSSRIPAAFFFGTNLLLRKHGVKLISCSENVDDTPSGKLLYGLMAEIAQFYSGNLALEVMKGSVRKAEEGGTPFRAPIGYLNVREMAGGINVASVILDPERAQLVRWCFEQYATGEWGAADLLLTARAKGLTSKPTPTVPSGDVALTTFYHMLQNPYYMGIVSYRGVHYEGKHPVLVEPDVWLTVQDTLAANAHDGEKDRKHTHYLRSTIYCSSCRGRLVYSESTGHGGRYAYFTCVKKRTKRNNCRRTGVRLERIENGIADFYAGFRLSDERVEQIRTSVRAELAAQQAEGRLSVNRATKRKDLLTNERKQLLQAHYAGAVPTDLLGSEMKRLTREIAEADVEIAAAKTTTTDLEAVLEAALAAVANCEMAYLAAPNPVRRQINQGFFKNLLIGEDGSVEEAELTEPFAALLADGVVCQLEDEASVADVDVPDEAPHDIVLVSHVAARPLALVGAGEAATASDRPTGAFWAAHGDVTE
jgi:site-specific DNA recombinase